MRPRTFPRSLRSDEGASAPFAVVAVILMLGAGVSYAYLAHLDATLSSTHEDLSWTDTAVATLESEVGRLREALDRSLDEALEVGDHVDSTTLLSSVGSFCAASFDEWMEGSYPSLRGDVRVRAGRPRVVITPIHAVVATGNVLGQVTDQRLPVALEATATSHVMVEVADGSRASRDVSVSVARSAPQLLAAQLQNHLEHALSDEGLVHMLLFDAVSTMLVEDPCWAPSEDVLELLVRGAISAAQASLFGVDTSGGHLEAWQSGRYRSLAFPCEGGGTASTVEAVEGGDLSYVDPVSGLSTRVRLVPRVDWIRSVEARLTTHALWAAEAAGPASAVTARLRAAGWFEHSVRVWCGGEEVARAGRHVSFRSEVVAWTAGTDPDDDGSPRWDDPQVEDWRDLNGTMSVVAPRARRVTVGIGPEAGGPVSLSLDGAYMGQFPRGAVGLMNVPTGPHALRAWTDGDGGGGGEGCETTIRVPYTGQVPRFDLELRRGADPGSEHAFWFAVMSAFHRGDGGALSHLRYIARTSGYGDLPEDLAGDPAGKLPRVGHWVDGLLYHLDHLASRSVELARPGELGCWEMAREAVSISKLTLELLVELPEELLKASTAVVRLSSEEGWIEFSIECQGAEGPVEVLRGVDGPDGCAVESVGALSALRGRAKDAMTALSYIGCVLSLAMSTVELARAVGTGDWEEVAWAGFDLYVDMACMALCMVKVLDKLGALVVSKVASGVLTVVGAAIAVVSTFLDAYRDAEEDVGDALHLLLHPGSFSDALRSAGFLSAVASIVTTVVVTWALPSLTGATVAGAFTMAVAASTGVGLIVFGAALAVWAALNWDQVVGWVSGTAKDEDVGSVRRELEGTLASTMAVRAQLNALDVEAEVLEARSERAVGLALMGLRTCSGDAGLVEALGGAGLYHLDAGSARGRRARAAVELGHWIEVLWRQVDDLVDDDRPNSGGERSEGFRDYKGSWGSKDHTFDADILVTGPDGVVWRLEQARGDVASLLRGLDATAAEGMEVEVSIEGSVYGDALEDWVASLAALSGMVSDASGALARASRETTFTACVGAEADYTRVRGLLELRVPEGSEWARVRLYCPHGEVIGDEVVDVGPEGAIVAVTGHTVTSRLLDCSHDHEGLVLVVDRSVSFWDELGFGEALVDHSG